MKSFSVWDLFDLYISFDIINRILFPYKSSFIICFIKKIAFFYFVFFNGNDNCMGSSFLRNKG